MRLSLRLLPLLAVVVACQSAAGEPLATPVRTAAPPAAPERRVGDLLCALDKALMVAHDKHLSKVVGDLGTASGYATTVTLGHYVAGLQAVSENKKLLEGVIYPTDPDVLVELRDAYDGYARGLVAIEPAFDPEQEYDFIRDMGAAIEHFQDGKAHLLEADHHMDRLVAAGLVDCDAAAALVAPDMVLPSLEPVPVKAALSATAKPAPALTPAPTPRPTKPPMARLEVVSGEVNRVSGTYLLVAKIKNTGDLPASVPITEYSVTPKLVDARGKRVPGGEMDLTPAFGVLEPGETGYWFGKANCCSGSTPTSFTMRIKSVEAEPQPFRVQTRAVRFKLQYGVSIDVSATIANRSSRAMESPVVGAIFLDARGRVIGGASDNFSLGYLGGKDSKAIHLYGPTTLLPTELVRMTKSVKLVVWDYLELGQQQMGIN